MTKKSSKTWFLGQKCEKITNSNFLVKNFFLWIDSECFETYFKMKNLEFENFFTLQNFCQGLNHWMAKIMKNGYVKNFKAKKFVEIDSECFETLLNTKISRSNIFLRYKIFSWHLVIFIRYTRVTPKPLFYMFSLYPGRISCSFNFWRSFNSYIFLFLSVGIWMVQRLHHLVNFWNLFSN